MNTFPPIADYAFLSDCEVSALVAPDGSVEWFCLPRPDSPSLFGSLLDRSAGFFRFGPSNSSVPDQRRYVPGTMVLETTWHTSTGWMTVEDLLVVGPAENDERLERYKRVPGDSFPQGTMLRIATCYSGRVEVQIDCLPLFDYGLNAGEWSYDGSGYDKPQPQARRPVADDGEQRPARHRRRARVRAHDVARGPIGVRGALVGRRASDVHGRSAGVRAPDAELLARLAEHRDLPRPPVAPVHRAQRARAQGPELRADRRHHGREHHVAPRDSRRRTQLGLPLHVDPRHRVHVAGAARSRLRLGGVRVLRLHPRRIGGLGRQPRRQRRRRVQSPDHVRDRRRDRPHRAHPRPSLRIRRLPSRAHRQRCVQPASARRVGDAPRRRRLEHPQRRPDGAADLGRHRRARRHRDRDEPRTRPGHLGDAGQATALRGVEGDVLGGGRAGHPPRRIAWRHRARREMAEGRQSDARRDLQEGGRRPGDLHPVLRHRRARRVAAVDPDHGLPAPRRRARTRHRPRHRRRAHQRRPRPPLQGGVHRRRAVRRRGHVHDLLILVGLGARDRRRDGTGAGAVREAALVRRPVAPLRRGDRRHHRAAPRQLPAGVHAPRAHRRRQPPHRRGTGDSARTDAKPSAPSACRRSWWAGSAGCPRAASSDASRGST